MKSARTWFLFPVIALGLIATLLSCNGSKNGGSSQASSEGDSIDYKEFNYALGTSMAMMYKEMGIPFEAESFTEGVQAELKGNSRLTPEEANRTIQETMMRRHEIMAQENAANGIRYMDSIAALPDVMRDTAGFLYRIVEQGQGPKPNDSSTVEVYYEGRLIDGTVFDSTVPGAPLPINLRGVIPGWRFGLQHVQEGGTIELIIPPHLAYGERPIQGIPGNSTLHFKVTLNKVQAPAQK